MTPVVPSLTSNIALFPGATFTRRKNSCPTKCYTLQKYTTQTSYAQKLVFPASTSVRLFPCIRTCSLNHKPRLQRVLATGTEVAVEESDSPASDKDSRGASGIAPVAETSENISSKEDASQTQSPSKRARPGRRSEMPPVKNEELIPGATFTGKVRSIQPFGAFIDFGAFTDGLVHVSNLSDGFVKDVGAVVSIGQEVKVRLLEANSETGRISLTMRGGDDVSKLQQSPADTDRTRPPRRNNQRREEGQKTSKFVKGQELVGKVKNLARAGAFISLPDGEEGFLPTEEEADDGLGSLMGASSLQVDQEVNVRVLRITRGRITLTMKKDEDVGEVDSKLSTKTVHAATNPFLLAFRKNKDIAAFLDEREKEEDSTEDSEDLINVPSAMGEMVEDDKISQDKVGVGADTIVDTLTAVDDETEEPVSIASDSLASDTAVQSVEGEAEVSSEISSTEESISSANLIAEEAPATVEVENIESEVVMAKDESQMEQLGVVSETPNLVENEKVELNADENGSNVSSSGQVDVPQISESISKEIQVSEVVENQVVNTSAEDEIPVQIPPNGSESPSATPVEDTVQVSEVVENQLDTTSAADEVPVQTPPTGSKIPSTTPIEDNDVVPILKQNGSINNSNGQSNTSTPKENTDKAISPALVKQLRSDTGAGMMDCKKALSETGGDMIKAQEYLRKKGLASADKKASRATAEGRIGSYIHDGRIGVLIEANCETDFVSRGDIFKELVDDLAMEVAACPQVLYINTEDVPNEFVEKEKELEMQREDLQSKPEQIRSKIVEGRMRKRLEELALLEQPYIKDDKVTVKDLVKQTIARIGENMKVKRFVRYNLGEGLEKKNVDFAAEVAAQTAAKNVPAPPKDQPSVAETKGIDEKAPKATISAALVKQLREETGAGMMDCKKALSETGGDVEKAQEYLRKKGLSAADKKSSRIAAEGRIGSYIHDSRIGVLIEVNCETDFVGRSKEFRDLVDDLAMQVVASTQVQYVSVEDIPESIVSKEKELEMQREDILSKPENIRGKIVEGRVSKRLNELALLEQPFIKDDKMLVKDLVKLTVATIGENIKVRRFVRFTLGEEIEAKPEAEAQVEE